MKPTQKKIKRTFINETLKETWKTIHTERPTEVVWCDNLVGFICDDGVDTYWCDYESFFQKHVIQSNVGRWPQAPKNKNKHEQRVAAGWLALINGHNIFEAHREILLNDGREAKHNEGGNLLTYINERTGDAEHSLQQETLPSWLCDDTFNFLGVNAPENFFEPASP